MCRLLRAGVCFWRGGGAFERKIGDGVCRLREGEGRGEQLLQKIGAIITRRDECHRKIRDLGAGAGRVLWRACDPALARRHAAGA